ncbi:MAG: head maturation protease, ClpP-related [Eubacteriaceae bacterium]
MAKVKIRGVIVSNDDKWIYDWFGVESTSPGEIDDAIEKAGGDLLEVEINSGGGDVYVGSEIYTALKSYPGNVTTKIVGVAASAASIIAMAGDKTLIAPTAEIMIHNVASAAQGDYRTFAHESKVLKDYNSTIANAYILKSGMGRDKLLDMMNKETWLTPQQALEYKLVDEIMFDKGMRLSASISTSYLLPIEVLNKMRNERLKQLNNKTNQPEEVDFLMLKNQLEIERNRF